MKPHEVRHSPFNPQNLLQNTPANVCDRGPGSITRDPDAPTAATEQRGKATEAVESEATLPWGR